MWGFTRDLGNRLNRGAGKVCDDYLGSENFSLSPGRNEAHTSLRHVHHNIADQPDARCYRYVGMARTPDETDTASSVPRGHQLAGKAKIPHAHSPIYGGKFP